MANPSSQSHQPHSINDTLKDTMKDTMRDASDKLSSVRSQASDIADNATDMASEFYDNASLWLNDNYGRVIAGVAVASAIGAFGYFLGRKSRSNYLD